MPVSPFHPGLHTLDSAVGNVTHLCALRAELTAAPPKVFTVPDTERLSVRLIGIVGITICSRI